MKLSGLFASSIRLMALVLAVAIFAAPASAAPAVYVVNGNSQFGVVNLSSGSFRAIGAPTPEPESNLVWGPNGLLYTLGTISGNLETINPATGMTTVVGSTGLPFFPTGISTAFDLAGVNGKLYLTDFSNNLYSVNANTGAATLIGATGMPPDPHIPFTINPDGTINLCDEILYGVGGRLYSTFDSFTADLVSGNVTSVVVPPNLWRIDPSTGSATLIGPTSLNLDGGVEVNGKFYAFNLGSPTQLVTVDLADGSTAFVTNVDPAAGLIFGAAPTPEPGTFLLLGSGLTGLAGLLRKRWQQRP
jgi:PEP-CTERM motif